MEDIPTFPSCRSGGLIAPRIGKSLPAHFQLQLKMRAMYMNMCQALHCHFRKEIFFGIFQPDRDSSRLRAYYIDKIGPPNYYYDPDSSNLDVNTPPPGIFVVTSSTSNQDDQPLVAVEISKLSLLYLTVYSVNE